MKNLVILLVILGVIWYWRSHKAKLPPTAPPPEAPPKAGSVAMSACAYCKLHVPDSELVQGQHGAYCSAEHLRLAENG
ncbi:MAG: PP0621 family protein [Rhodoferax sp.]|uniref:PP0621 family protein n=1 Tax=Rhodoferax sp. TaxID=50421 RepID=UPI002ACE9A30|nr:PP0621 family protein [Rhodoferax sp.]MDZ7891115.1 PP0621 family protein [Rhodoferax sp.]